MYRLGVRAVGSPAMHCAIKENSMLEDSNIRLPKNDIICQVENVSKAFPGVVALNSVSFDIRKGEIHGIIGKNGAGKSTIVNILAGFTQRTSGEIIISGEKTPRNFTPKNAEQHALFLVPQNPLILPQRSITENLFIGYTWKKQNGLIEENKMRKKAEEIIDRFGFKLNPDQEMGTLPIDTQKLLLFGKGIYIANADIFMLDEITASLNIDQRQILDSILQVQVSNGKSIIFISHHLKEILKYCQRVTVLRNGCKVTTMDIKNLNEADLTTLIVGKDIVEYSNTEIKKNKKDKRPVLQVKKFSAIDPAVSFDFELYENEVLGFIGLEGCGKEELFETLVGSRKSKNAEIVIDGSKINMKSPKDAISRGIGYLPGKREEESVFHDISIIDNMTKLMLKKATSKAGLINSRKILKNAEVYIKALNIKFGSLNDDIDSLSGGNKQKVMISRIMGLEPKIYILNEPTQGIDIETKQEILKTVREKMSKVSSVIIASESIKELMAVCDRIIVLYRGNIKQIFCKEKFFEDEIYMKMQGA